MAKQTEKYMDLMELATTPGNTMTVFENGTGLIKTPTHTQGVWVSRAIIDVWKGVVAAAPVAEVVAEVEAEVAASFDDAIATGV